MTSAVRFPKRTGFIFIMVGLFLFVLYLRIFVPFGEFAATIQQANMLYYSLAFAALLLSGAFYSLTWHNLLRVLSVKTSFLKAFQFILIGSFVDILVPAESVSGDVSRIYLMSKESGENAGKVVASVVGHRFLSGFVLFAGFLISSVYFILVSRPEMLVQGVIAIILLCTVIFQGLLFYLSTRKHATEKLVNWLINLLVRLSRGHWKFEHLRKSAEKMLTAFHDGIATFGQHPRMLVSSVFFAIIAWFFDLLIVVFVFLSLGFLGVTVPLSLIVVVYSIGAGLQVVPIGIPAEIGVYEIIITSVYTFFGVPIAVSAVATLLTRVLTLWTRLLIGGVAVQWLGIKGLKGSVASN